MTPKLNVRSQAIYDDDPPKSRDVYRFSAGSTFYMHTGSANWDKFRYLLTLDRYSQIFSMTFAPTLYIRARTLSDWDTSMVNFAYIRLYEANRYVGHFA